MANNSTYQYEPLHIPSNWNREERQFAQSLCDVLDDIYLKWGRIGEKELSSQLRNRIVAYGEDIDSTNNDLAKVSNNVYSWLSFAIDGLKIGKSDSEYYTLTDNEGFHIMQGDSKIASFAKRTLSCSRVRIAGADTDFSTGIQLRASSMGGVEIS